MLSSLLNCQKKKFFRLLRGIKKSKKEKKEIYVLNEGEYNRDLQVLRYTVDCRLLSVLETKHYSFKNILHPINSSLHSFSAF